MPYRPGIVDRRGSYIMQGYGMAGQGLARGISQFGQGIGDALAEAAQNAQMSDFLGYQADTLYDRGVFDDEAMKKFSSAGLAQRKAMIADGQFDLKGLLDQAQEQAAMQEWMFKQDYSQGQAMDLDDYRTRNDVQAHLDKYGPPEVEAEQETPILSGYRRVEGTEQVVPVDQFGRDMGAAKSGESVYGTYPDTRDEWGMILEKGGIKWPEPPAVPEAGFGRRRAAREGAIPVPGTAFDPSQVAPAPPAEPDPFGMPGAVGAPGIPLPSPGELLEGAAIPPPPIPQGPTTSQQLGQAVTGRQPMIQAQPTGQAPDLTGWNPNLAPETNALRAEVDPIGLRKALASTMTAQRSGNVDLPVMSDGPSGDLFPAGTETAAPTVADMPPKTEGKTFKPAQVTNYWPGPKNEAKKYGLSGSVEGGIMDARGNKIWGKTTMEDYLAGRGDYVTVAMDKDSQPFKDSAYLESPQWPGVVFRVMDNGGHGNGKTDLGWVDIAWKDPKKAKKAIQRGTEFNIISEAEAMAIAADRPDRVPPILATMP